MHSDKSLISLKESHTTLDNEKTKEDVLKKRIVPVFSIEDTNLWKCTPGLQSNGKSGNNNAPYSTYCQECFGVDDVLITPPYMEFVDGIEGIPVEKILTLKNLGEKVALIKILKTNSMSFDVKVVKSDYRLYPGLSLKRIIRYSLKIPSSSHAMIQISINGNILDYHLYSTLSFFQIKVEPLVIDMGSVDILSLSDIKKLTIHNTGGKSGRYSVDVGKGGMCYKNVTPPKGIVKAQSKIVLGIQVKGKSEGTFQEDIWIKSNPNVCIKIVINIIKPQLIIRQPTTMDRFTFLNFPPTFCGSRRFVNIPLHNASSHSTSFIFQNDARNDTEAILEMDVKANPTFDVFRIYPLQGRLLPQEEIIVTVEFAPTLKNFLLIKKQREQSEIDYFTAKVRLWKVNVKEAKDVLKIQPVSDLCTKEMCFHDILQMESDHETLLHVTKQTEFATLYLHGDVEIAQLELTPDEIDFGDLNIGDASEQVIIVKNPSKKLSLVFECHQKPCVKCEPREARLDPGKSIEVTVRIVSQFSLGSPFKLEFDLWTESMELRETREIKMENVARIYIQCKYNPLKASAQTKSCNYVCKVASFDKLSLEPNYNMTYPVSELEFKLTNQRDMTKYIHSTFSKKIGYVSLNDSFSKEPICHDMRTLANINEGSYTNKLNVLEIRKCDNKRESLSRRKLLPIEIDKICVSPMIVEFGKVGISTTIRRDISFENNNTFPVKISLISLDERMILFPEGGVMILEPNSTQTRAIQFSSLFYGNISFYFNYAINDTQKYQLPVTAQVVPKSIEVVTKEIIFERDCFPQEGYRTSYRVIEVKNNLNLDTKFRWILPADTNFRIEPQNGSVPPNGRLYLAVYQELDHLKSNRVEAEIQDECGGRTVVKLEAPLRPPNVILINGELSIGEIPLNLTREATAVLYNAEYFGVFFEIDSETILKGIRVTPIHGSIPPRGIVVLRVSLKFDACVEFSTIININIQKRLTLQLRLSCNVVFPRIRFKPSKIDMKNVSSRSLHIQEIQATNLTNADATLQFYFKEKCALRIADSTLKQADGIEDGKIIKIRPLETIKLFLQFYPCDLAYCSFYLPIIINSILGPITDERTLLSKEFLKENNKYYLEFPEMSITSVPKNVPNIFFESVVSYPIICFNKVTFEFSENLLKDELIASNKSENAVSFTLIVKDLKNTDKCPFHVKWVQGVQPTVDDNLFSCVLLPYKETTFEIKFKPEQPGEFLCELAILLGEGDQGAIYDKLILKGSFSVPSIESDILEIYFVPIDLRILAKEQFLLKVKNFPRSSKLTAKVCFPELYSGNFNEDTLKVNFPNGDGIKRCSSQDIKVQLVLRNYEPTSFNTELIFFDSENLASVSIRVFGSIDCSILTTYLYRKRVFSNFLLKKDQHNPPELTSLTFENDTTKQVSLDKTETNSSESNSQQEDDQFCSLRNVKFFQSTDPAGSVFDFAMNTSRVSMQMNKLCYPYFPLNAVSEERKTYMFRVLQAVEMWLYASVLGYQYNPKLTTGITAVFSDVIPAPDPKRKDSYPNPLSIIDILVRLTHSNEINKILSNIQSPQSSESSKTRNKCDNDRISEVVDLYKKIFRYLSTKGAGVSHIPPEFLLCYNDYKEYTKTINCSLQLAEYVYSSRSKQSWLDLILQIYKCFVFKKIDAKILDIHSNLIKNALKLDNRSNKAFDPAEIHKISKNHERQSKTESLLLAWLEYNHNQMFKRRELNHFEECDALVFIAITLSYCPFLKEEYFNDIYRNPISFEEKVHNAICLLLAWKQIRLGFVITPTEIVNPHCIQVLMLAVHLFQILPTFLIKEKIIFECPLTETINRQIRLPVSKMDVPISYVVQFFGQDSDVFSSKSILPVKANQENMKIRVTYDARKLKKSKAYLVLSGSAIGPDFGENQVFLLEGFPNKLTVSGKYLVKGKLYRSGGRTLTVKIPYTYHTEYEIWLSNTQLDNIENLNIKRWEDLRILQVPRRLFFVENKIMVNEDNKQKDTYEVDIPLIISCIALETRTYWVVFRSEIADFIVQLDVKYQTSIHSQATIEIWENDPVCFKASEDEQTLCFVDKVIQIPSKNTHIHDCLRQMFKQSFIPQEREFWERYLDNYIGIRFISWLMKDADELIIREYRHVFKYFDSYNVAIDKADVISILPKSLKIDDLQIKNELIDFDVHISNVDLENPDKLTSAIVTMTSLDKKEVRKCKVTIIYKEPEVDPKTKKAARTGHCKMDV